jgi:WD40 repeat protein
VRSLAAHPKDRFFATGDQQGNISLYEFPSGLEITHWQAHESQISALAFNQNGMILVSGDEEGKFKIWDIGFLREEMTSLGLGW